MWVPLERNIIPSAILIESPVQEQYANATRHRLVSDDSTGARDGTRSMMELLTFYYMHAKQPRNMLTVMGVDGGVAGWFDEIG